MERPTSKRPDRNWVELGLFAAAGGNFVDFLAMVGLETPQKYFVGYNDGFRP